MVTTFLIVVICRSRKGAWIEIAIRQKQPASALRRSRKGAWIEIVLIIRNNILTNVAPVRERGLKFAIA